MAKFIRFEKTDEYAGRPVYSIINKRSGDELGKIGYYAPWRGNVAHFNEGTVWSMGCLRDLADAMFTMKAGEVPK